MRKVTPRMLDAAMVALPRAESEYLGTRGRLLTVIQAALDAEEPVEMVPDDHAADDDTADEIVGAISQQGACDCAAMDARHARMACLQIVLDNGFATNPATVESLVVDTDVVARWVIDGTLPLRRDFPKYIWPAQQRE